MKNFCLEFNEGHLFVLAAIVDDVDQIFSCVRTLNIDALHVSSIGVHLAPVIFCRVYQQFRSGKQMQLSVELYGGNISCWIWHSLSNVCLHR